MAGAMTDCRSLWAMSNTGIGTAARMAVPHEMRYLDVAIKTNGAGMRSRPPSARLAVELIFSISENSHHAGGARGRR